MNETALLQDALQFAAEAGLQASMSAGAAVMAGEFDDALLSVAHQIATQAGRPIPRELSARLIAWARDLDEPKGVINAVMAEVVSAAASSHDA
ncbi:hypothetical protein NQ036_03465 [Brevibacterium sp. 91QC2O2]|uniref:hypothetical protein n=1 Tax=Brevibacterium sp. 91QC2O2 TaxID=2968458 RepID=UPI00211BF86E|nr:hypothetical protein [Brevibacterium sp. 91QC2O2]MCQ9367305.1 hypothetical protein [Brevibacterium sp. 91QC2O2]